MQFIEEPEEPENEEFEFFLERELDFSVYETKNKYEFDLEMATDYDKPKLNRNNIQFHSYFDKFIFDNDIDNLIDGKDTNYFEQQDSESIFKLDDNRLCFPDSTNRGQEEA
jgi:hypothetical protein